MERIITNELLKNFEISMLEDEKSRATVEKYLRDLHCFVNFANERAIDKTLVLEYKAQLAHTYALTSANSMLAALNAFLRFAGWLDCCVRQFKIQKKAHFARRKRNLARRSIFRW